MDFPPVTNLLSATFDGLNAKSSTQKAQSPVEAPQPVATGAGLEAVEPTSSPRAFGTGVVGTLLNTVA